MNEVQINTSQRQLQELQNSETPVTSSTPRTDGASSRHLSVIKQTRKQKKKKKKKKSDNKNSKPAARIGQNIVSTEIAAVLSDTVIFDTITSIWHHRNGKVFVEITDARARRIIRTKLEKSVPNFTNGYLSGVVAFVRDDLALTEWTDDRYLLPLENGIVDLKTGVHRDYGANDRFSTCLPIEYNKDARCPHTLEILKQLSSNNDDVYRLFIACLYAILTRRNDLQKYLELIGPGGTGKSTLINLMTLLVGEHNRAVTDLKELENNRFESASLHKKYLIIISDSTRYGGDVAKLKAVTGGDPLRNEVRNKQQSEPFICTGFVVLAANKQVQSTDYTSGLARRQMTLFMNHKITDAEKDKYPDGVEAVFKQELPGLLNYLLDQDSEAMIRQITRPARTIRASQIERTLLTNPILSWANDCLVKVEVGKESKIGNKSESPHDGLYSNYCLYCDNTGVNPVSLKRFSGLLEDNLQSHGVETGKTRTSQRRVIRGLALRNVGDKSTPTLITQSSLDSDDNP